MERVQALASLKENNIRTYAMIVPILPGAEELMGGISGRSFINKLPFKKGLRHSLRAGSNQSQGRQSSACSNLPEENHQLRPVGGSMVIDKIDINSAIELMTDNRQKKFQADFKRYFSPDDRSRGGQLEIIVSHLFLDNYTGRAEQYSLNKETGRYEMGWHEHPMPLDMPEPK